MSEAHSPCGHRLSLSEEQLGVLECYRDGALLIIVIAKAGTGKTRTAAALACLALALGRRVLLLSFTQNGVKELASELAWQHGLVLDRVTQSHWQGQAISLRTFDSMLAWSLGVLGVEEARRERAGLRWQVTELERVGGTALRREGQDAGLWTPRNYDRQLREVCDLVERHKPLCAEAKAVLAPSWRALRDRATRAGLILPADYDRLAISHAAEIAEQLAGQFEDVVDDEHQDSSERDVAPLVQASRAGQLAQVHFGDSGQAVMTFRGADGDPTDAFRSAGCSPEILALTENRRSSPEIVLAGNSLQRAAGWTGPIAVAHPANPRGPNALLALVGDEAMALDSLMVVLAAAGLAAAEQAAKPRVPGNLADVLEARGGQLVRLCHERAPLVEVICPTNKIAEALVGALEERGVEPAWVCSVANPFDSIGATLLDSWFDGAGNAVEQARMLLTAQANAWTAGTELLVREELRACADVVLNGLERLPSAAGRREVAENMSAVMREVASHPYVGEEGQRYIERALLLIDGFARAPHTRSVDEAVVALEETLVARHLPVSYRRTSRRSPSLLQVLKSASLRPAEVPAWLDEQQRRWRLARSDEPSSGILIKTPEIAKGDTCDGVVVFHAEILPRPERRSVLAAKTQDLLAGPAQAYIAVSRPRFLYISLACGKFPPYHDVPLEGWEYLDARSEARGWGRTA